MKRPIPRFLHRSPFGRAGWAIVLGCWCAAAARAQTVAGSDTIRFPATLPFVNGRPNLQSAPILAGGNVGGVAATNNIGATNFVLKSSVFGHNVEHLKPDAYLGDALAPPVSTSGATVVWAAMTNTALVTPAGAAFFEASVRTMYAAVGGQVVVRWHFSDGTHADTTYVVESAPEGRPYRVYWTDRGAPKVNLAGAFVKFHYNDQITAPQWQVTTNANNIVESNVVAGLYLDASGSLNAVGGQQGMIVMQYFKNGMYNEQVSADSVIVIEVLPPDNQTLNAYLGERILPQGGVPAVRELTPEITAGLMEENTYLYQHVSADGSPIPKMDWIFPIRRSVDSPWNIEIYWKVADLMGTLWFYEVDNYAADWPPCFKYVRGSAGDLGAPLVFPSNLTPSIMAYQEPEEGCATLQNAQTLITTTNAGRCLVQLTSADENTWFLPIELTTRYDPNFDLRPVDWMISREIRPFATARSILFPPDMGGQATVATNLVLGTNFSVECWVLTGNLESQTNALMTVFDKNTPGGASWSNQFHVGILTGAGGAPGVLQATMGSGRTNQPVLATLTTTNRLHSFHWSHVVLTFKSPRLSLYVNGSLGGSVTLGTNGVRQTNSSPLYLGAATGANSAPLSGALDNLRIWDIALTADQVKMAMEGNHHGYSLSDLTNRGLRAYFPIDADDTVSQLHDLTGRYNGHLNSGCFLPDVGAVGKSDLTGYTQSHGYIYEPSGTSFNTNFYRYPAQQDEVCAIFGVNTNTDLEVWWSREVQLPDMPSAVYIPNWVQCYRNVWPAPSECPHIVLASGEGSKQGGIYNQGHCLAFTNHGPSAHVVLYPDVYFSGDFTAGAWVYLDALPSSDAVILSVANSEAAVKDNVSMAITPAGKFLLVVTGGAASNSVASSGSVPTGQWTYVMASLSESTASLYLNETLSATQGGMPSPGPVTRTNCYIGFNGLTNHWRGRMDEVRIWRNVLNEEQREAAMYNVASELDAAHLTAHFSFDPFMGNLIEEQVSGYRALVMDGQLSAPGAPASGTRRYTSEERASLYVQNNATLPGYNPNEEHAILNAEDGHDVVYAFRDDLSIQFRQSGPFVLVNYFDAGTGWPGMDAFYVARTSEVFETFHDETLAGSPLEGPHPLDLLPRHWTGKDILESGPAWRARNKTWFAVAGGPTATGTAAVVIRNYYPMQEGFWFPGIATNLQPAAGTAIPWLPSLTAQEYQKSSYPTSGLPTAVHWTIAWPEDIPVMRVGDTLIEARDGLPDIWNQLSVEVAYDTATNSVALYDPVCPRGVTVSNALEEFGFMTGGASPSIYMRNGLYYFHHLPPDLSERFYYNPALSRSNLVLIGQYKETLTGSGYLLVNVLDDRQRDILRNLVATGNELHTEWSRLITTLANGNVKLSPNQPFSGIALHTHGEAAGHVALAFNNATNPAMGISAGTPVTLALLQVVTNLATGSVIPLEDPYNLLSEQMNMLFSLDFAGEPGRYDFEWRWSEPNIDGTTPSDPLSCEIYTNGVGLNFLVLDGKTPQDLVNRFFTVRYRALSNAVVHVVGTNWSEFTRFSLAEGWVQRILNALTPFEQRMRDLYNNPVETQISMIHQAGRPYEGDVALNQDNLNNVGLLQLYHTVLHRAQRILDESGFHDAAANQQLLLAASRLNDLYMLLGNEAYADAHDPTIGFGSSVAFNSGAILPQIDYGAFASSLFCFDNQVPSLLDEELALLRGRGNPDLAPGLDQSPVYNRLYWNYTKGITAGEVAYSVNYDITGHTNVVLDATTASDHFPQGHGDAWGYYLDALTVYYRLLRHSTFDWGVPSISPLLMNDLTIDADYYDEKKFAEAAAALARTGVDVIQRTYRKSYDEAQSGLFQGYVDSNTNRAWGVGEWGPRVGVGALCNWMVGNSLLPAPYGWLTNAASLSLDVDGIAHLPAHAYFHTNADFTIEWWIRPRNGGGAEDLTVLTLHDVENDQTLSMDLAAGTRAPGFSIDFSGVPASFTETRATVPVATDAWTHVAAVLEGTHGRLYVNGALAGENAAMSFPVKGSLYSNCWLGAAALGEAKLLGALSEVRVWKVARTAEEIAGAMNHRLSGGEEGLAAYWPLNEGEGASLLDRSGNWLTAQTEGGATWTNDTPALAANVDFAEPGILKIDRSTVRALGELSASVRSAQAAVDNADRGMNPLGLGRSSIPFDLDPRDIDGGGSHFEQILARAETALNNAYKVFDAVQDAKRRLRQQQQSANNFQAAAISQEADYKRRLIEIYGYPYADDIGAGKTYPDGYDGPDLYHYMYVDMSALGWSGTEIEPIHARTYVFVGDGMDSVLHPYGFATNEPPGEEAENVTNTISFYYADNGLPCKPTLWTGSRRAEGRLQMAYAEFLKQLLSYRNALTIYDNKTEYLVEMVDWYADTFAKYKYQDYANNVTLKTLKEANSTLAAVLEFRKLWLKWRESASNARWEYRYTGVMQNQVFGTSTGGDIFSVIRAAMYAAGKLQQEKFKFKDLAIETLGIAGKWAVESAEYGASLTELIHNYNLEADNQETELNELARGQVQVLEATKVAFQGMLQAYQNMVAIEEEGQRLLASRERDRGESANRVAAMRYTDMAFRMFRDEAIGRYAAAFDLAAMYTYLAAKAYDYETGLLPAESANDPGARFLGDVVKARTLGRIEDGEPQVGSAVGDPGLADILARMKANWSVLDGRLGFNNPTWRQTWFSLRTELFRIVPGSAGDANWRTALNACKVANLFEVPEFRRYCIPFAAQGGLQATEPALVIPFSSTIDFGHNFFGRILAGGDHAFSSTEFATKIRSIGIWFSNYAANVSFPLGLANTPEAYLIPVGVDTLRSPSDITGNTLRHWQVLDQAIPVPYVIGSEELNDTDWIPLYDSLPDPLAAIRRYSALGAWDDNGAWSASRINYSSRLIGRSVWNSQWYLIIPAGSMNAARSLALEMFINGRTGDGNGIKDIKLLFETYSYSGN